MEKKEIRPGLFLTSYFSVWYEPKEILVLSDLHLGYEAYMGEDGFSIPRSQKEDVLDRLSSVIDTYEPRTVLINGDFKHEFSRNRDEEFYEVMDVIDYIEEKVGLMVLRGNHDNFLKTITENKGVPMYEGSMDIDGVTFAHGHEKAQWDDILVIGHEHPAINIRDEMGGMMKLPCYMYEPEAGVLILPAFGTLVEGRDMLNAEDFISDALLSSASDIDIGRFEVYAITEGGLRYLHRIKEIREVNRGMM